MAAREGFNMVVPIRARFRDTDGLAHVNNAVFFTYFEEARAAYFLEVAGIKDYQKVFIILARATCDFRTPAYSGEELDIAVRVDRLGGKSFDMSYQVHARSDDRLVAEGTSVQVAYDYSSGKSVEVPATFRRQVESFEGRSF